MATRIVGSPLKDATRESNQESKINVGKKKYEGE